jgi:hypothetical protein
MRLVKFGSYGVTRAFVSVFMFVFVHCTGLKAAQKLSLFDGADVGERKVEKGLHA